jgi:hypothetical protein
MNTVHTQMTAPIVLSAKTRNTEKEDSRNDAPASKDTVILNSIPDRSNWVHKGIRGLFKVTGGTLGMAPGAAYGAVKESANGEVHEIGKTATKAIRTAGALAGLFGTAVAGFMAGGPPGALIGLIAGPILGAGIGQALWGLADGAFTALKGSAKGVAEGACKGAEIGGKVGDRVAKLVTDTSRNDLIHGIKSRYGVNVRTSEEFDRKFADDKSSPISFADLKRGLRKDLKEDREGVQRVLAYGSDLGGSWRFTVDVNCSRGKDGALVINSMKFPR